MATIGEALSISHCHVAPTASLRSSRRLASPPSATSVSVVALLKRNPKRLKYAAERLFKKREEGMMYVKMDQSGEDMLKLEPVIQLIKEGAVGVIPTDTVYSIVCDMKNNDSIDRLRRIKGIGPTKPLSILCHAMRDIDKYTMGFPRGNSQGRMDIFRLVKHCLPGPYTFILTPSKELPRQCIRRGPKGVATRHVKRREVGVRIPDDTVCQHILDGLDSPLTCTSVKYPAEDEWILDPVVIADIYKEEGIDFIVDDGIRVAEPSTVVDMTGDNPTIIRLGKGPKLHWMVMEEEDSQATSQA
ncbi:Threonylcarbamoyl-AMP synthase [Rhynchospora pubera]|uniref:Threonylcarbamoyl-AMP synthase n=1 Tax=Rhynchospora pubera TaxID=906938 RepID=A0AAV8AL37_9POAL|nr:Threonylcarbamoyl-AMP synthase [Rhynchospora pubera]KAJ4778918.1 Threonylcarbamoyl-AMP synthase [Rhynchospora pubera]